MKFYEQKIQGVWLIEAEPFMDERGMFYRSFCQKEFRERQIVASVVQTNISKNRKIHTLRGFHYQAEPFAEDKTLTCIQGNLLAFVIDLRPESDTFLKWISVEVGCKRNMSLHVPKRCANAFLSLDDNTQVLYHMSEFFNPEAARGIRYNDPFFDLKWPAEPKVISDKDLCYPDFDPASFLKNEG